MNKTISEITRVQNVKTVCNEKCNNFYYMIYCRVYNTDKTMYKRYHFIMWYDIFDIQDYFEDAPRITKKMHNEYITEIAYNFIDTYITDQTDFYNTRNFLDACNETIKKYYY